MGRKTVNLGLRNAALISGELNDLDEWDLEELKRGRRRDKNGGWRGVDPKVVPAVVWREYLRRLHEEVHAEIRDALLPAARELRKIAEGRPTTPEQVRAIGMVLDRGLGKVSDAVAPAGETAAEETPRWEQAITAGIVAIEPENPIIDTTARALPTYKEDQTMKPKPRKPRKAKS